MTPGMQNETVHPLGHATQNVQQLESHPLAPKFMLNALSHSTSQHVYSRRHYAVIRFNFISFSSNSFIRINYSNPLNKITKQYFRRFKVMLPFHSIEFLEFQSPSRYTSTVAVHRRPLMTQHKFYLIIYSNLGHLICLATN